MITNNATGSPSHPASVSVCGVVLAGDAVHAFPPDLGQVRHIKLKIDVLKISYEYILILM
jgi:hypothetical protein